MNNRGQVIIVTLMFAVVVIILALAFAQPVSEFTNDARNSTNGDTLGLDCANTSISDFNKATCVSTDLFTPYFIGFLLAFAGAVIGAKLLLGGAG